MRHALAAAALVSAAAGGPAAAVAEGYRSVTAEVVLPTDALSAWRLWTTDEGVRSFFPAAGGIDTNIELRPGGPYEIFLIPGAPEGSRGCDGCVILGYQEGRMLSFTWTNRPDMATRPHRTHVVLNFEPLSPRETRVTLVADGWGVGADWDVSYDYFSAAWPRVLAACKARIERDAGGR